MKLSPNLQMNVHPFIGKRRLDIPTYFVGGVYQFNMPSNYVGKDLLSVYLLINLYVHKKFIFH